MPAENPPDEAPRPDYSKLDKEQSSTKLQPTKSQSPPQVAFYLQ